MTTSFGPARQTSYWLVQATDAAYAGLPATTHVTDDASGAILATVPAQFATDLAMEGSARLADGRVVNYSGGGSTAPRAHVEPASKPWGTTADSRPAVPLRTMAVDRTLIPLGSRVYVPQLAGWQVPSVGGAGGFTHDGWFVADDTGGAITGQHVDLYVGPHAMYDALRARLPSGTLVTLTVDRSTAGQPGPYLPPPAPSSLGGVVAPAVGPSPVATLGLAAGLGSVAWRLLTGEWPWEGW